MHKIVFWRGSRELAENPWPHEAEAAVDYLRSHLVVFGATHAEVINAATREVIYSYGREAIEDRQASQ